MFGYSQTQQQWEIIHTHCHKSYSEKEEHIAVNCLSSGEAGSYSKKTPKTKTQYKMKYNTIWFSQESLKNYKDIITNSKLGEFYFLLLNMH